MDNPGVQNYVKLFKNVQEGGGANYPIFHGTRYSQYGNGFGDILRGIFRFILPIAARGVSTFVGETVKAHDSGADWKTSLKSAVKPTAYGVVNKAFEQMEDPPQKGSGKRHRKRKKTHHYKSAKKARQAKFTNWNF
jgi:hypothetical protein